MRLQKLLRDAGPARSSSAAGHTTAWASARLEAECFLVPFVRRVKGLTPVGPPAWYALNMLRALERLPLMLTPA
jgi:hypothetical protein